MSVVLKPDAKQIEAQMQSLQLCHWLQDDMRCIWPWYLFHETEIRNVSSILESGCILSRERAEAQVDGFWSSGSPRVLDHTGANIKDSVRLYFRPRTPTQYHNEGVWPKDALRRSRFPDAHCPIPVFLLFDAVTVLSMRGTQFSNGNLARSDAKLYQTARDLERLPWQMIYHIGPHPRGDDRYRFHRCAEVVVPAKLDLGALEYMICRSQAELDTLTCLLPPTIWRRWKRRTLVSRRINYFFRERAHLVGVELSRDRCFLRFAPSTRNAGPFVRTITREVGSMREEWGKKGFCASGCDTQDFAPQDNYLLSVKLDEHLVYRNRFIAPDQEAALLHKSSSP